MLFASLPPADRRALSEMMARVFNPLANPVMGVMGQSAGPYGQRNSTIQLPKDVFLAKITDVSGTGYAALYSFVEMQIKSDGTGLEETFNGRVAICCVGSGDTLAIRPARYILDDTLTENTLVLARVSIAESNEFEILGVLDGTGGGISTGGCSGKLGWTLDTASLTLFDPANNTFPRAMSVAVLESFGRCECVAAPAGDAPTIRFFQALEDGSADPFAQLEPQPGDVRLIAKWNDTDAWEGLGSLSMCCSGCSDFTFEINTAATLLLERPVFTMTVYGGCTDGSGTPSPKTFTLWTECGNDRYIVLAGFDNQACEFDPRAECVNLFRIGLVCVSCNLSQVGCTGCAEKIAAQFFSVSVNGRTYYLQASGDGCSCAWSSTCGGVTMDVTSTTVTLTGPDWSYVGDFSMDPEGTVCRNGWVLTKESGGEEFPATVIVAPRPCRPMTAECCLGSFPEQINFQLVYTGVPGTEEPPPYCESVTTETILYWSETALDDGMGNYTPGWIGSITLPGSSSEAPTCTYQLKLIPCNGDSVTPPSYPVTLWIDNDDYLGTMNCDSLAIVIAPGDLCGCPILADWSWSFQMAPLSDPYWCVPDGADSYTCVQSETPPEGYVSGPNWTAEACAAACACAGGSGSGLGLMASALPTSRASIPLAKSNPRDRRYVPMPMAKCSYLGDLLTPCTSCGGKKVERDVYACDHPDNEDGRCTKGDPGKFGEWTCGTCDHHPSKIASREWPSPIDTRHLLFHIAPVAFNNGEAWRWNVEQVRQRQHLFNGRKVAAVLTPGKGFSLDSGMVVQSERWNLESVDAVREALGDGWDVIEMPNDPKLREVATWVPLWSRLEEFALPGHAAFYCHSKGVTRTAPQIREWTRMLYESNLDFLDRVDALLAAYPIVGPFKKVGRGWAMKDTASAWHFSGTFMHVRLQDFFRRDWKRVDPFWSGTEAWPGIAYDVTEAGCLFHEGKVETMNLYSPKYIAAVATEFNAWKSLSAK